VKTSQVAVGDTALHVVRDGSGPPLLFLVGLGGRAEFWKPVMARFADRFDCISFDHRATGDSVPSDVKQTVRLLAEDALALLDALGIERAHIVGHSLGGAIAQHIAVHAPERVDKLVLSATWAGPTPFFEGLFALRKDVLRRCGPEAYMLQGTLLGTPGWHTAKDFAAVEAGIAARMASFAGVDIEMDRMDAVTGHDLRARVPGITAETLVVCARDDQITPLPLSEELARLIPGARLDVLPAGNHFGPSVDPEAYAAMFADFLG
jgi:aminoacrylate hydrolase